MRHKGLVNMTLFVIALFLRLRVCSGRQIPPGVGDDDDIIVPGNATLEMDASINTNVTDDTVVDRYEGMSEQNNVTNTTAELLEYNLDNSTITGNTSVRELKIVSDKKSSTETMDQFPPPPRKELPMAMIIAGPAAAVSIFLFLCIAYYFHNLQLNKKVKRLSITLYVTPDPSTESSNCDSSNGHARTTHKLVPAPSPSPVSSRGSGPRTHSRDNDIFSNTRRKSIMPPSSLGVPNMNKRGSNWSAIADKEILTLSAPRRHSTFII